jgi:glyoxylase-like metal-dependent hydrolase (beta-lactamase superfamily II)
VFVLVDVGEATTPEDVLWPYLSTQGLDFTKIRIVLITHADTDHFGGTSAVLKRTSAIVASHGADAPWIASPDRVLRERYGQFETTHRIAYAPEIQRRLRQQLGGAVPVVLRLTDGSILAPRPDWQWRVLHLPGHTPGHLGLFESSLGVAVIGDAALGEGLYNETGRVVIPPSYYDPGQYLQTLTKIERLSARVVLTGHLPILTGGGIAELLSGSRSFVKRLGEALQSAVNRKTNTWTLLEITEEMRQTLGPWPQGSLPGLARSVLGHLKEFENQGEITQVNELDETPRWQRRQTA